MDWNFPAGHFSEHGSLFQMLFMQT
jgi:hypothetical protein